MSGTQPVYIPNDAEAIWDRARGYARTHEVPLSSIVARALAQYLADRDSEHGNEPTVPEGD